LFLAWFKEPPWTCPRRLSCAPVLQAQVFSSASLFKRKLFQPPELSPRQTVRPAKIVHAPRSVMSLAAHRPEFHLALPSGSLEVIVLTALVRQPEAT
jgi:hypothetical protein